MPATTERTASSLRGSAWAPERVLIQYSLVSRWRIRPSSFGFLARCISSSVGGLARRSAAMLATSLKKPSILSGGTSTLAAM